MQSINLTGHFDRFIEEQIEAGRYKNADEVVQAGLRLLEQQEQTHQEKLALLRRLAAEGIDSLDRGEGLTLESDEELAEAIAQIGRSAAVSSTDVRR